MENTDIKYCGNYYTDDKSDCLYDCWLRYDLNNDINDYSEFKEYFGIIYLTGKNIVLCTAADELSAAIKRMTGIDAEICLVKPMGKHIRLAVSKAVADDGYAVYADGKDTIAIDGGTPSGTLYGMFRFVILAVSTGRLEACFVSEKPSYPLRMIDSWDNADGSIERGYSGQSIFFGGGRLLCNYSLIRDYARLLASTGINAIVINNVNVHKTETYFITDRFLEEIYGLAEIFRRYGIKIYLSVNFAAPAELDEYGRLDTADPLDERVRAWWKAAADRVYSYISDFGGFLVKADSENRPGPFTYGRNHADGANMLAQAIKAHGGNVIWRCFVYDCHVDWRDRKTDRARAAYDCFKELDGKFDSNVYLQIKNGPMDFQIREATSPLLGAMPHTNCLVELQITQEYTGQQKDLCYLVPMWKECLDFNTRLYGGNFSVGEAVIGAAGVSNLGNDRCRTGNPLAAANLYGYGRLIFNPSLSAEQIAGEWICASIGRAEDIVGTVSEMLVNSRDIYESYTSPLGIGWMVTPHNHYGVDVDGYEYSVWGTYHYADRDGVGVDRTSQTGTGFTLQYSPENTEIYDDIDRCPENLLLFFHHVPYTYNLKSGKTLIQHIYDTHFDGAERAELLAEKWNSLKGRIPADYFNLVKSRLELQIKNSIEWRDVINTYFYRKSGVSDANGRIIFK